MQTPNHAPRTLPHGALPADSHLWPLRSGYLLLSRTQATFCGLSEAEGREVGLSTLDAAGLSPALRQRLEAHGFFDAPRPAPPLHPTVQLQLTNACNLRCTYCCTDSAHARDPELPPERWFGLIPEILESVGSKANVALLGGEIFLLPWSLDLAERILESDLPLTLFSNGLPLVEEVLARKVAALMARGAKLRLSLAGPTASSCDGESGGLRFEPLLEAVRQLDRFGARPILDLMLTPQNGDGLVQALPALRKRLPPGLEIAFGLMFHGGREKGQHLFPDMGTREALLDRIAFEAGERIPGIPPSPLAPRREACSCALGAHLHVRSDGKLFSCFKMVECVGDLAQESFKEAYRRVKANPHPAASMPLCAPCALATLCGGGCRAENLQFTGDADTPICGPWRIQVLAELLAEDRPDALEWPVHLLLGEARKRGIPAPDKQEPFVPS